jgi:hypothetical protein
MAISYKGKIIDRTVKSNTNTGGTNTLEDVSGNISPIERVSSENLLEASNTNIRRTSNSDFKTPSLYTYDRIIEAEKFGTKNARKFGVPSMFNPYTVFTHPGGNDVNDFFDIKGSDGLFPKYANKQTNKSGADRGTGGREISLESLLKDFDPEGKSEDGGTPSTPYYASDFLYAKYFRKIPLNKMITLRRFPFPTYDNLDFVGDGNNNRFKPIAQAVTYFGEPTGNLLNELTKFSGNINWEEMTADVHDVEGNEQGFDSSPFGGSSKVDGIGKAIGAVINPKGQDLGGFRSEEIEASKYNTFEYTNKVLGPVNVINQTYVRQRGIGSKLEFDITFEYELRSYNNINPRLAMLDILCNMLALTFNNAKFWGGANRYFPRSPQFGFVGDEKAFYSGRYGDYMDSVVGQISNGLGDIGDKLGDLVGGILSGNLSGLFDVAKKAGGTFMDLKRAKSRPKVLGFHALLSGLPIGEWHLTIGNPYRPIMMVGNLICKGFEFEMSDHLGVDDFPSQLKFKVKLESGRPRDKGDIESIFNLGQGRVYHPPSGLIDITNTSSTVGNVDATDGVFKTSSAAAAGNTSSRVFNRANVSTDFAKKIIGTNY